MADQIPRVIAFAGSLRKNSFNKMLLQILADGAREAGAEVRVIDLNDFPLPLFNADLIDADAANPHTLGEQGGKAGPEHNVPLPESLLELKKHIQWSQGWLVTSPEYNRSYSGVFKNMVDFLTRLAPGETPLDNFTNKVIGIATASEYDGGKQSFAATKALLTHLGCIAAPGELIVTHGATAFDEAGGLKDAELHAAAQRIGKRVVRYVRKLA